MKRLWSWMWAKQKKWRGVVVLGMTLFVVGSLVSVEVTSRSQFCGSCHIMVPYYESWQTSAHSDIKCVKCHIEPGMDSYIEAKLNGLGQLVDDTLNRTGFKPSASVTELSCTRSGCHTAETLAGKTVDNGVFRFRHDKHLGKTHLGVEISCGTCHSHVTGDEHFEVNTSVCITCHMLERDPLAAARPGSASAQAEIRLVVRAGHAPPASAQDGGEPRPPSSCLACHDAPREVFESNGLTVDHEAFLAHGASCESCHMHATAQPPPIEDGRCVACHTFGVERTLPVEEMHQIHAHGKHKIECFSCHGMIQHGLTAQAMSLEQFDCQQCHIDQHSAQRDAYLLTSSDTPDEPAHARAPGGDAVNPMFLAHVDCTGCHVTTAGDPTNPMDRSQIRTASAESCDRCHEAGTGSKLIPLWQRSTRQLYDTATRMLESIEGDERTPEQEQELDEARRLLNLVRLDGSWGVHNPTYTQKLLESALTHLRAAKSGGTG
jgi:nitrate/TMAO reductase-like tetraheme cytochrome c subunit